MQRTTAMLETPLSLEQHKAYTEEQESWLTKNANHGRTLGLEQMSKITTVLPHRPMTPISDYGTKAAYAFMFQKLAMFWMTFSLTSRAIG